MSPKQSSLLTGYPMISILYHCRAGIYLGGVGEHNPGIKSGTISISFPLSMQNTRVTAPCRRVNLCLNSKKCGNAKQVTAGICTIPREGTGRGRYPRGSGLTTFRIPGGALFAAARRSAFARLQEQAPRKKYDASCRRQTKKSGDLAWPLIDGRLRQRIKKPRSSSTLSLNRF